MKHIPTFKDFLNESTSSNEFLIFGDFNGIEGLFWSGTEWATGFKADGPTETVVSYPTKEIAALVIKKSNVAKVSHSVNKGKFPTEVEVMRNDGYADNVRPATDAELKKLGVRGAAKETHGWDDSKLSEVVRVKHREWDQPNKSPFDRDDSVPFPYVKKPYSELKVGDGINGTLTTFPGIVTKIEKSGSEVKYVVKQPGGRPTVQRRDRLSDIAWIMPRADILKYAKEYYG